MALLESTLKSLKGQMVVIVTSDVRTFRGILKDADDGAILLEQAVEGTVTNTDAWSEVTMGDAIADRSQTGRGSVVFQRHGSRRQWRLTRVLLRMTNVHRVWAVGEAGEPERAGADDA